MSRPNARKKAARAQRTAKKLARRREHIREVLEEARRPAGDIRHNVHLERGRAVTAEAEQLREKLSGAIVGALFECKIVRESNIDGASPTRTFEFYAVYERDKSRWQSRFTQGHLEISVRNRGWLPAIGEGDRFFLTLAPEPPGGGAARPTQEAPAANPPIFVMGYEAEPAATQEAKPRGADGREDAGTLPSLPLPAEQKG